MQWNKYRNKNKTNRLLNLNKKNNYSKNKLFEENILLSELETNYSIIKNKYNLLNNQTALCKTNYSVEINILLKQINHLNKLINEKDSIINNLRAEIKLL